jgi:hypothetical protein
MRISWKVVLPLVGLLLFAGVTYHSTRGWHHVSSRYFWWSSIPLDSTPLSKSESACKEGVENCQEWGPQSIVVDGLLARALILSAIPAFFLGQLVAAELGRFGVSEVLTFMGLMPLLIGGWFHFLGRLIDSWRRKRRGLHAEPSGG